MCWIGAGKLLFAWSGCVRTVFEDASGCLLKPPFLGRDAVYKNLAADTWPMGYLKLRFHSLDCELEPESACDEILSSEDRNFDRDSVRLHRTNWIFRKFPDAVVRARNARISPTRRDIEALCGSSRGPDFRPTFMSLIRPVRRVDSAFGGSYNLTARPRLSCGVRAPCLQLQHQAHGTA